MNFAQNFKYLREQKGVTQNEIAKVFEVSQPAVGNWETGRREPELGILVRISEYFNVTVDELLTAQMQDDVPLYLKNLLFLRKKNAIKQRDVAELLCVSCANASKYENGVVGMSVEQFIKLADFYGVTLDQLVKQDLSKEAGKNEIRMESEQPAHRRRENVHSAANT